jgi:hypothetical protein
LDITLSWLVGEQANHQAVGLCEECAVGSRHGSRDERLPAVDVGDTALGGQWLVDPGDVAVVDVQVRRAPGGKARHGHDHPEVPVVEQRDHAAVHGIVSPHVRSGEAACHGDAVGSGVGDRPWWQQRVAQPGQIDDSAGRGQAFRHLVVLD